MARDLALAWLRLCTKENIDARLDGKKIVPDQKYILLPLLTSDPSLSKSLKDSPDAGFKPSGKEEKIDSEHQENKDVVEVQYRGAKN
ncbi:hypothetical protein Tco_1228307 [Tanacetum coccineum]